MMTTPGPWSEARAREAIANECDLPASSEDLVAALDAIDAVLALHPEQRLETGGRGFYLAWCPTCDAHWPCPTVRALGVTE